MDKETDNDGFEHPPQRKTARPQKPTHEVAVETPRGSRFRCLQEKEDQPMPGLGGRIRMIGAVTGMEGKGARLMSPSYGRACPDCECGRRCCQPESPEPENRIAAEEMVDVSLPDATRGMTPAPQNVRDVPRGNCTKEAPPPKVKRRRNGWTMAMYLR